MAVQTTEEFKNSGSASYTTAIEKLKDTDLKVRIGGALQDYVASSPGSGEYTVTNNPTTIVLGAIANDVVHIYRETNVETPAASFQPGSSIRAVDLNAIHDMARFASVEHRNDVITDHIRDGQVTSAKIKDGTIVNADINASAAIDNSKIADGLLKSGITINSANIVDGSIVNDDVSNSANISGSKLADDSVSLNKLGSGTLPNDIVVTRDNIQNGTIQDTDIATGTLDNRYYTETELDAGQLDNRYYTETQLDGGSLDTRYYTETELDAGQLDNRYFTETELNNGQLDNQYYTETELDAGQLDNRYYTETEADGRFLRQDSTDVLDTNATWTTGNTHVATTGAIEARIVDLIDDVGGFDAIANETSFPTTNPQGTTGQSAILSIAAVSATLTPSSNTITIANGAGSGNTVTINNVTASSVPQGFGLLVESTSTLHTYNFHRLIPKALDVNTVATNITNVVAAGANVSSINNFADKYIISSSAPTQRADGSSLQNGDLWYDSSNLVMMVYDGSTGDGFSPITPDAATIQAINSVSGHVTFAEDLGLITNAINTGSGNNSINTVGANIAAVNTVASDLNETTSEIETVAGSITNVNLVGNDIANVNATGTNISNVNAVASNATNINAVKNNSTNINAVAGNATNINTVSASIADVNRYAAEYLIQSSSPSSPSAGDLWYNSTANNLNYYTGGAWVAIAPGIAGLINDANPALANHLDCNDKNLTEVGTVSGDNLQIDFGTL